MSPRPNEMLPGSQWLQKALGSTAIYEVIADHGDHLDVEVRQAPGLVAGTRIRLTRAAVAAMQPLQREGPAMPGADS